MSIILTDPNTGSDGVFNVITFVENEQDSYFKLLAENGDEMRVAYIPHLDSSWGKDDFDLFLFDNPYLNAENDVFEIYESSLHESIGWIFPITILVSNDNDFSEVRRLNRYKFAAQSILLNLNKTAAINYYLDSNALITDIYNDSSIICILNKQTTSKINDFNINDYILSFYKYGYSFLQENSVRKKVLEKEDFIREMRQSRKRISIKKSLFDISLNSYIESLFKQYLLKTDDFLVRFIFLYQIIEQLMEDEFNILFQQYLTDFTNQNITKNDFKDYINTASKERELIKFVFNKTIIEANLKDDFESKFNFLYTELNFKIRNSLPDKIYDFRNLVTHSYRNVMDKIELINVLIQIFEEIIVCTLINYTGVIQLSPISTAVNI